MFEMLNAGCILKNRYEVRDLILCDEKEVHYLVEDLDPPHEQLTLKEFFPGSEKEIEGNDKFWQRLSILCEVRHPNLLKIYEFFTEIPEGKNEKRHYVAMEYIKGRTLQDIFQNDLHEKPLPIKVVLKHMIKVCSALKYLNTYHSNPMAFGALRPKYIMLTPDRQIKLFNYGLGNLLRTGFCSKTPGFTASEQITKGIMNEKTDVYSLGATMHYLLTGKNPEDKPKNFDSILDYNKEASPELNDFILKCISLNEEERPTFQDVSNFLLQFSMGKRPKSIFALAPKAPPQQEVAPTPDKIDKFVSNIKEKIRKKSFSFGKPPEPPPVPVQEEVKIEQLSNFSANIAEPSVPEVAPSVDIFTLSDEKPVSPVLEKTDKIEKQIDTPGDIEFKPRFQSAPKRGTRRFDVKHYMAAAESLKTKKETSPELVASIDLAAQKAKESRERSAELFSKLTAKTPPVKEPPSSVPVTKTPVDVTPPAAETKTPVDVTPPAAETKIPVSPGEEKQEEKKPGTEDKTEPSLAQKLAQKYSKKKEEPSGDLSSAPQAAAVKTHKAIPHKIGQLSSDWKEQKISLCQKKPDTPPILAPLQEGTAIKDRYEIAEIIHQDCYGAVYMVLDTNEQIDEGKEVSKIIKEIQYKPPKENHRLGEKIISNFVKLGGKLKSLNHPNLIKVTDYFFNYSGDRSIIRLFLVMEMVEGYTLEHIIKSHLEKQTRMPSTTVFAALTKVCDALHYLHSQKPLITAGDLNPKNILFSYNGDIKFINYGLREIFLVDQELVYPKHGIIGYFAPEQTGVDITNTKADVFALGATMYYLLTGINPEEQPYEFTSVRKINPYISPNVEEIVNLCVKIKPAERSDIKLVRERMNKITMVELDSSLMEKQKEMQEKRQASMEEIGNISPLSSEFIKLFLKYGIAAIIIVCLVLGGFKGVEYYKHLPTKGPKLYLSVSSDKKIEVLDINKNTINQTVNLQFHGGCLVASVKRKQIFITDGSSIYVIDSVTNKPTGKFDTGMSPSTILLSPDEAQLYLLSVKENKLKVIDINNKSVIAEKELPMNVVTGTFSSDSKKFFLINNNKNDSFLLVIDTPSFVLSRRISIKDEATDIDVSGNGQKAFIAYNQLDEIDIVDLSNEQIESKKISSGKEKAGPIKIRLSNDGQTIYSLNQLRQEIAFIKISDFSVKDSVNLKGYPIDFAIMPDNIYIYTTEPVVGGRRRYFIIVLDKNNKKIVNKIPLNEMVDKITLGEN